MISTNNFSNIIDKYVVEIQSMYHPSREESTKHSINTKIAKILEILVGTCRSTRLGPKPLNETLEIISENIRLKIKNRLPLNATICFGCKKTWKLCNPGIDLAELFTFLQLLKITKMIKNIYPPGINYSLYLGDAWYDYIYHDNSSITEYFEGLQKILDYHIDLKVILISMYSFHIKNSDLYKKCDENLKLLRKYWNESSGVDEKAWQNLKSYKNLISVGWVGIIPNIMRAHYFKKMNRYIPKSNNLNKIEAVLRFFAYGLMLNQHDLTKRLQPDDCTVDISLLSPPPGMPKRLRGNRLYIRSLPSEISSRGAPCWTVMGIIKMDKQGLITPSTLSPRDYNEDKFELIDTFDYSYQKYSDITISVPIFRKINYGGIP